MDEQPLIQKLIPEELVEKLSVESFYIEAKSKRPILRVSEPLDEATEQNLIGLLGEVLLSIEMYTTKLTKECTTFNETF